LHRLPVQVAVAIAQGHRVDHKGFPLSHLDCDDLERNSVGIVAREDKPRIPAHPFLSEHNLDRSTT
jgi:hypothetical protein